MSEAIAQAALKHWGLNNSTINLIAQRENVVYRVDCPDTHQCWALRLHRPGLRTQAEIHSEAAWVKVLSANGLSVPTPVATHSSKWCIEAEGYWVDLQVWLQGDTIDQHAEQRHYYALGKTMAQLHTVSDDWSPPSNFQRFSWDLDGLLGEHPVWGQFWDNSALNQQEKSLLHSFRTAAATALNEQRHTLDYGLIHADLVSENVLVNDDQLHLIDFDDSGFGYRLFDMATVLLRLRRNDGQVSLTEALIEGYLSTRTLDMQMLNLFLALRACTYIGWIIPRMEEAQGDERCARFIKNGCKLAQSWLDNGT